jgi:cytochrome c peroxidase
MPAMIPAPPGLRVPELPPLPPLPVWADDPSTPAKLALGTALFYDVRLSGSGHSLCDGCHSHYTFFQDNLITAIPDRSYPKDRPALGRNTPSLYNLIYAPVFRWDGSHTDLIDVLAFPFSEANMNLGLDVPEAQGRLRQRLVTDLPGYQALFQSAYGADLRSLDDKAVWRLVGRALGAFLRQVVSRDSAFDRWNAGEDSAMGASAVRGLAVFRGKGRCLFCHSGPLLTDFAFHNLSTAPPGPDGHRADEGRYLVSGLEADRGAFLTPTLRSVYDTAPYFHDGSRGGLRAVLLHLSSPEVTRDPNHDPVFAQPLELADGDIDDLIDFLEALRGAEVGGLLTPPASFP